MEVIVAAKILLWREKPERLPKVFPEGDEHFDFQNLSETPVGTEDSNGTFIPAPVFKEAIHLPLWKRLRALLRL